MDFKMLITWLINQSDEEIAKLLVDFKTNCLTLLTKAPPHINSFLAMPCSEQAIQQKFMPIIKNMIAANLTIDLQQLATVTKGASLKSLLIFLISVIAANFSIDSSAPEAVRMEMVDKFKLLLGGLL